MAFKPYKTSNDLIEAVTRKISFPLSQNTFSEIDILRFLNEEMSVSQVPNVLSFHEEYFVYTTRFPLEANRSRYPIPDRAIGMKLRDLFFEDTGGNLYEMSRVSPEDKAFFQRVTSFGNLTAKFYMEGNDVVLVPEVQGTPTGELVFNFYLRPNQLVKNDRACTVESFVKSITVTNASISPGDIVTIDDIDFTAVSGSPSGNEFQIGGTSIITATNLKNAINSNGVASADNGTPSTNVVNCSFTDLATCQSITTLNSVGFAIQATQGILFDQVPTTYLNPETNVTEPLYSNGSVIDFLQTKPGHRIYTYDITIPVNGITATQINFVQSDVPSNLILGDYICLANEAIIPQLPPELHDILAERACARILSAIGDQAGLQSSIEKLKESEFKTGSLIDDRMEGSPQKITQRKGMLAWGKIKGKRRL